MIPVFLYDLKMSYNGGEYSNVWTLLSTEEEIEKIANVFRNMGIKHDINYSINEDENAKPTHFIDSEGQIWCKTAIKVDLQLN